MRVSLRFHACSTQPFYRIVSLIVLHFCVLEEKLRLGEETNIKLRILRGTINTVPRARKLRILRGTINTVPRARKLCILRGTINTVPRARKSVSYPLV